ncbi:hypothetical protein C8R44DRAFT_938197 [Mycena epipterygia]|nr:hypothetical protein C8R44DRAFT_938197 [Mycena epipterygia]
MYPKDGLARKGLVLICVCLCTLALIADCANVFLPTVTYWGMQAKLSLSTDSSLTEYRRCSANPEAAQYWPSPLFVTTNTFIGVLVNSYLIHRFYNLSKNLWISAILFLFVVMGFVGSIMVAIALVTFSDYSARDKLELSALIWIISTAAADILTAAALIWKLRTMKTTFKGTKSLIQRLTITAIQTGSATSIASIITLISYIAKPTSNVPTACFYLVGPLYVISLLYNLNLRQHDALSGSNGRSNSEGNSGLRMDGIHVHRTAMVTVDDPQIPDAMEHTSAYDDSSLKQDPETENYGTKKLAEIEENLSTDDLMILVKRILTGPETWTSRDEGLDTAHRVKITIPIRYNVQLADTENEQNSILEFLAPVDPLTAVFRRPSSFETGARVLHAPVIEFAKVPAFAADETGDNDSLVLMICEQRSAALSMLLARAG